MPQDAFTLKFLCEELNNLFSGGKINKIVQPGQEMVVITVYTGKGTKKLVLDVNPAWPRIGVSDGEFQSPLTAPNFCMLLRKHLLSATIDKISLVGFDRVVRFDISPSNELFDSNKKALYVELMGRYSNIILTENGKVLGGNRGVNFFDNGVRPLIVNHPYTLPPTNNKKCPEDRELINVFSSSSDCISKKIIDNVQGFALSTANEIESRFLEKFSTQDDGENLYNFLKDFINKEKANPCVLLDDELVKDAMVFPYKNVGGKLKFFDKLYLAEDYYYKTKNQAKKTKELRDRLLSIASTLLKKVKKKDSAISSRIREAESAEENKLKGELILANIYKIRQGEERVILDNYYDQSKVEIALDKNLSVQKNAENYYKKYNKQKRALAILEVQKNQVVEEENYLESLISEINLAKDYFELSLVREEMQEGGLIKDKVLPKKAKEKTVGYREYSFMGFTIKSGRNNLENDHLTLSCKKWDIWVHSKAYHSSHVIVESENREVPMEVIVFACEICAYYSKDRNSGKSEIVYTEKKNVKKPSKAKPGFFTYGEYKSILVSPNAHESKLKWAKL
ncbi:MAG: NFACT family protein [Clostridia bacterium]|nr:NFACT family protein [Clostridia bacterium]